MSLLLAQRATPRCPLVFRPANKSRAHCSQQPRWKYLCVCVRVCARWHPIWRWLLSTRGRPVPFSQLEPPPPHRDPGEG